MAKKPGDAHDPTLVGLTLAQRREVSAAYAKLTRNELLSKQEKAAIARFERDREERLRWEYYRSIPKKHWQRMSGRQVKVINEQAIRYDLPLGGPTIDLPQVATALHDFLAKNAQRLAQEDDPLLRSAGTSPALERYRDERALMARLDRLERERQVLPRQWIHNLLERLAYLIRDATDRLERRFGAAAAEILRDALDDFARLADAEFCDPLDFDVPGVERIAGANHETQESLIQPAGRAKPPITREVQ